jgi:hypothetical protein
MKKRFLLFPVLLLGVVLQCGAATIFDINLIVNGDAEAGIGSADGTTIVPSPGWSTVGNFNTVQWGIGGGFPALSDAGPADRGDNFFAGGPDNDASSGTQTVDLSGEALVIDSGIATFVLDGYLGGFAAQEDNAVLRVNFLDSSLGVLGTAAIGPVSAADRANLTALLFRSASGSVPVGTRFVDIALNMTRTEGAYNDGYADNLSLVLSAVPEASTSLLFLGGGSVLILLQRRRRENQHLIS